MVSFRYITRNVTRDWSRRNCYLCWNKYLALARSNSFPDHIGVEQSGNGRYKDIAFRTYVEINSLFKFRTLWAEELGLFFCRHDTFLHSFRNAHTFSLLSRDLSSTNWRQMTDDVSNYSCKSDVHLEATSKKNHFLSNFEENLNRYL